MATVREGNQAVLMVIDMQVGVMQGCWDAARVARNVAGLVERARASGVPVVWVQHQSLDLAEGSEAWAWVPELVPAAGELQIQKHHNSAFEATSLVAELSRLGATHIVLAGAATNWCIRATAYGALERGYDLTLVEDGHTTGPIELDDGRRIEAELIIQELNVVLAWLTYPGRASAVAAASTIDFARPGGGT
ncbi:MAG: isochorismatase family protein [Candidatus Bipolaricaulota bacterium]